MNGLSKLLAGTGLATMMFAYVPLLDHEGLAQVLPPDSGPGAHTIQQPHSDAPLVVPNLTEIFMSTQREHGNLLDMDYLRAESGHAHYTRPGQTLWQIAGQYHNIMGTGHAEAVARLIAFNDLELSANSRGQEDYFLANGQRILIPLPHGVELHSHSVDNPTSLTTLVSEQSLSAPLNHIFQNAAPADIAAIVANLNGLDSRESEIEGTIYIPAFDDFTAIEPLTPPPASWGTRATLSISEWNSDHHRTVFEYATDMAAAINPDYDRDSILPLLTPSAKSVADNLALDNLDRMVSGTNEQLIFSRSVFVGYNQTLPPEEYRQSQSTEYQDQRINNVLRYIHSPHTFFVSAGNERNKDYTLEDGSRETLNTHAQVATAESIAGRAYIIGAAHAMPGNQFNFVAPYSSIGADFIGPAIPPHDGQPINGTSFSTPMTAALYRQMAEWYGGVLEPEEIMAAASMSTDMTVLDFDPVTTGDNLAHATQYMTNAGGRPYHDRAGAGMIDPQRWNETLQQMALMKLEHGLDAGYHSETRYLSAQSHIIRENEETGETEYIYNVPIPADMTLDRLSFILPQDEGARADSYITSPSGFTIHMPMTHAESMATSAFALEDVRAGDVLQIRSTQPFRPNALVQIRGYDDNNVIQRLRDHLIETGVMPQPNSHYNGNQLVAPEPPQPEPGYIERTFDSLKF